MGLRWCTSLAAACIVAGVTTEPRIGAAQSLEPAPHSAPQTATSSPNATAKPPLRGPSYEHFLVGDYLFSPTVYNEFSPGNSGMGGSYSVHGAAEFPAFALPWMVAGSYRSYSSPHDSRITPAQFAGGFDGNPCPHAGLPAALTPATGGQGCVTVLGAYGQVLVPSFTMRDTDVDVRLGLKIANPRIYLGVGHLHRDENYGYPKQNGFGFGAEKLPDLGRPVSAYASVWYYPNITGNFTYSPGAPAALLGTTGTFRQRFFKYQIGGALHFGRSRFFLDAGVLGDLIRGTNLTRSDASHASGYTGLGMTF